MSFPSEAIEAPLAPRQLAARWHALCADPTFEDVAGKVELTEWGEILMTPVGSVDLGSLFGQGLSGITWHGMSALRVSISNWSTTEADVDRTASAITRCTGS